MPSAIDITKPIYGTPTTQSVRDNFTIARDEITDLQNQADTHVNIAGDIMTGPLILYGPPYAQNEAATLDWVLQQLHSTLNALIYVGDYDGATDVILSSGQPSFVVGQPLPAANPVTSQYYFTIKTGHAAPGIGNQPTEGVTAGTFLISNGVKWHNFAMTAANITAKTTPIDAPPIPNILGANVYDSFVYVGQNYLMKSGGVLTGSLILNANPVNALGAVTKQYADGLISGLSFPSEAPVDTFSYTRSNAAWSHTPVFDRLKLDTDTWGHLSFNSSVASASGNQIIANKDNIIRWVINLGDANQDLGISRYSNAGVNLDSGSGYAFKIDRLSGDVTIQHHLNLDAPVAAIASLFGRGPNNPTNPADDSFGLWARSPTTIGGGHIGLRGPTYSTPNSVEIYAGLTHNMQWSFRSDGGFYTPGSIMMPISKVLALDAGGVTYFVKDASNNFILQANATNRLLFVPTVPQWYWQGPSNFDDKMRLNSSTGDLWVKGALTLGNYITTPGVVSSSGIQGTLMQSNSGRVVSVNSGGNPSFSCWDSSIGYAKGMFLSSDTNLYIGSMTGAGDYAGTLYAAFTNAGDIELYNGVGIRYRNVCPNGMNFRWGGDSYLYGRVDNVVELPISNYASDERMKADIAESDFDCLAMVMRTPLFQFRWRDNSKQDDVASVFYSDPKVDAPIIPIGFIAQRQYEIFPDSVVKGSEQIGDSIGATTLWTMNMNTLCATLFGAIQQLYKEILELKGKLQ